MAITPTDFEKIWSTNASTPAYTFTDSDYLEGWDFVGNLPPTRAQWNAIQKRTDEKMKYIFDHFGSPLTASTVADMTLENRVYVYTGSEVGYTAGDWYYYDAGTSTWVDGGVYNAVAFTTDTTLTVSGAAADSKVVGDILGDITQDTISGDWVTLYTATELTNSPGLTVLNGYIRNSTGSYPGAISSDANRKTFYFQATEKMYIYGTGNPNFRIRVSNEQPTTGNSVPWTGTLYESDTDTLPTEENFATINAGQYVAFYSTQTSFSITIYNLTNAVFGKMLKDTLKLTEAMQTEVNTESTKIRNNYDVFNLSWGVGIFSITAGADIRSALNSSYTTRRSCDAIKVPYPVAIGVDADWYMRVTLGDSSYKVVTAGSDSVFYAGAFRIVPANTPFRITVHNAGDTDISSVTDAEINSHIYVCALFPNGYAPVKWCAMGDSITQGWYSYNDGGVASKKDTSKTWVSKVAMINGWNVNNMGIGSTGWLDTVDEGDYTTAAFYLARNTDFTPYNLVTLAYGINDWKANLVVGSYEDTPTAGIPTTVMQAMRTTIEAIMASNPLCKIIVILPLNCVGYAYSYGDKSTNYGLGYRFSNSGTLEEFVQKMIEVCNYYGIQYIDQTHYSCINRENLLTCLPDGVHPSLATHSLLAGELCKKITFG